MCVRNSNKVLQSYNVMTQCFKQVIWKKNIYISKKSTKTPVFWTWLSYRCLFRHLQQDGPSQTHLLVTWLQCSHGYVGVRWPIAVERLWSSPHLHPGRGLCVGGHTHLLTSVHDTSYEPFCCNCGISNIYILYFFILPSGIVLMVLRRTPLKSALWLVEF